MNILITGGAGYVGSTITKYLQEKGYTTIVLDNLSTGNRGSIDCTFYQEDILHYDTVAKTLVDEHIDAVVDCAGVLVVSESVIDPAKYFMQNTYGTNAIIMAMKEAHVSNIVFSSTSEVYGNTPTLPITEEMDKKPLNPYGLSKWMAEQELAWADSAYGIKHIAFRYMNAAGAYPDGSLGEWHNPETHLIPKAIRGVLGMESFSLTYGQNDSTPDHSPIRDYVHPLDIAIATEQALQDLVQNKTSKQFNLGSGIGYSVLDIVASVEKISGKTLGRTFAETRNGEPVAKYASYKKVEDAYSWMPSYTLQDIIQSEYLFLQKHPHGYNN